MADSLGGILTNGMGADATGLILGPFRLKVTAGQPYVPPNNGGGGSTVRPDTVIYQDIVRDEERKRRVQIQVKLGKANIERTYFVSEERSKAIIKVVKWLNMKIVQTQFRVGKIRRKLSDINITFKNKDND